MKKQKKVAAKREREGKKRRKCVEIPFDGPVAACVSACVSVWGKKKGGLNDPWRKRNLKKCKKECRSRRHPVPWGRLDYDDECMVGVVNQYRNCVTRGLRSQRSALMKCLLDKRRNKNNGRKKILKYCWAEIMKSKLDACFAAFKEGIRACKKK